MPISRPFFIAFNTNFDRMNKVCKIIGILSAKKWICCWLFYFFWNYVFFSKLRLQDLFKWRIVIFAKISPDYFRRELKTVRIGFHNCSMDIVRRMNIVGFSLLNNINRVPTLSP
jgi:hypothetical protein